ncbi:hypothetical protein TRFO_31535 [Tritrichomonas foetus]|uniref:Uncharacterized protein n=1 Tax=Tritrichomonas foetus TaxID=1144522 RepID=A0A1J4JT00_9EUKA|nr:hypothetical protein TRFO_31535 [Tritrichomonas foetus]|eukprot:OHT01560.1 hypothetical protein TRFO_31535 [Tritrichomonas foetus]
MFTNKEEAFEHNSCKKIAQLSKVIFSMQAIKQDRRDEKKALHKEFDKVVSDFLEEHQSCLKHIFHELCKFRKACISNSCSEFGKDYKMTKNDFIEFYNKTNAKFLDILNEFKKLHSEVSTIQSNSLQACSNFLEYSEMLEKDLKIRQHQPVSNQKVLDSINPVNQKISNYENEMNGHLKDTQNDFKKLMNDMKAQSNKNIQQEINKVYPVLKNLLKKVLNLKAEIFGLRENRSHLLEAHSIVARNHLKARNRIIAETNQTLRNMEKQKVVLLNRLNVVTNPSNLTKVSQQLYNERCNKFKIFKQKYDALKKESHQYKHNRHQIQRSFGSIDHKTRTEYAKKANVQDRKFNEEKDKLLLVQGYCRKYIATAFKDTDRLLDLLNQYVNHSIIAENQMISRMQFKIEQKKIAQQAICESSKHLYQDVLNSHNDIVMKRIEELLKNDIDKEEVIVNRLKKELETQNHEHQQKIESKNAKILQDIKNYQDSCEQRILSREEDNKNIISRKLEIKQRATVKIADKFAEELKVVEEKIVSQNKDKLSEYEYKNTLPTPVNLMPEYVEHQKNKEKINAKINFWNQSIAQTQLLAERKIKALDQQVSQLDKQMRQYQRYVKSQIQRIDEDYEMKIQVVQVGLNHKIENLSKLFTKEENSRGVDIIDGIRRVKEAENRKLNFLLRKRRETEEILNEINISIKEKENKIQEYNNCKQENEILAKIEEIKLNMEKTIASEMNKRQNDIETLENEIEKAKAERSMNLQMIHDEILVEKSDFEEMVQKLKTEIEETKAKIPIEIQQKDDEFEKQKKLSNEQHKKEMDVYKKRIEYAKQIQNEEIARFQAEKEQLMKKCKEEVAFRQDRFENRTVNEFSVELDNKLSDLLKRQADLHQIYLINYEESKETQTKRLNLERLAVQKTNNLSPEFLKHFQNLLKTPDEEDYALAEAQRHKVTRRKSMVAQTRDSLRSRVFLEAGIHRRGPSLVTPLLVA